MGILKTIAIRYLRAKRRNSLLSLISILAVGGVALGVAALIVVLAVLSGFETNLKNKLLGVQAHITIYQPAGNIKNWRDVVAQIRQVPGVRSAQPLVSGQVMLSSHEAATGVVIMGLDPVTAIESNFFGPLNLTPTGAENLVRRPMLSPYPVPDDVGFLDFYQGDRLEDSGYSESDFLSEEIFSEADNISEEDISEESFSGENFSGAGEAGSLDKPLSGAPENGPPPTEDIELITEEDLLAPTAQDASEFLEEGNIPTDELPAEEATLQEEVSVIPAATPSDSPGITDTPPAPAALAAPIKPQPSGSLGEEYDPPIIIGRELSLMLGEGPLGGVSVISPFGRVTPIGKRVPLTRSFQIAGVFQANFYDFDSRVAFTTIAEAQSLLGMDNEISVIEIMVDDIYQAGLIKEKILSLFYPGEFWARDWMEMNMSLFSALKLEQTAMFVILTLIILVAAFNIASTLVMMVTEKTRDIAILKAMGATSRHIRRIFTIQGLLVGGTGTFLGLVIGVTLCLLLQRYQFITLPPDVYLMSTLPVEMRPLQILSITVVSLLISYLATLYPASQAASLDPVEAIRYE